MGHHNSISLHPGSARQGPALTWPPVVPGGQRVCHFSCTTDAFRQYRGQPLARPDKQNKTG